MALQRSEAKKSNPFMPCVFILYTTVCLKDDHSMQTEALSSSAVRATTKLGATMVLAFTKTGRTARFLAKYRAGVPILAVVAQGDGENAVAVAKCITHQCALLRGVVPLLALQSTGVMSTDGTKTDWALRKAMQLDLVEMGDRVVVSQCPRVLPNGQFEEAAVVKFVVVGASSMKEFGRIGSCMDMTHLAGTMTAGIAVERFKKGLHRSSEHAVSLHPFSPS
jgi:pyruvate kinase